MAKRKTIIQEAQPEERVIFLPTFFFGMFICALGVFLTLSVLTADITLDPAEAALDCVTGLFGAWAAYFGIISLGFPAACFLVLLCFCWGARIMRRNTVFATWPAVLGGLIMTVSISLLCGTLSSDTSLLPGGLLSSHLLPPAKMYFGGAGVGMAALVVLLIGAVMAFGGMVFTMCERLWFFGRDTARFSAQSLIWISGGLFRHLQPKVAAAVAEAGQRALVPVRRFTSSDRDAAVASDEEMVKSKSDKSAKTALEKEDGKPTRSGRAKAEVVAVADALLDDVDDSGNPDEIAEVEALLEDATVEDDSPIIPLFSSEEGMSGLIPGGMNEGADQISVTFADEEPEASEHAEEPVDVRPFAEAEEGEDAPLEDDDFPEEGMQPNPYEELARRNTQARPPAEAESAAIPAAAIVQDEIEEEEADEVPPAPAIPQKPYNLPEMEMLDPAPASIGGNPAQLEKRARVLEATLAEFNIQGKVLQIERGPRITQFEMSLAPGIKLSRVSALADNLAMALKAPSVRIIAPIPGRDTIGIEIPNVDQELVALIQIVEAVCREKRKQMLPLCLAKDVSGKPIVADLAKMPHLLIAGATGSGKSVCINSIIMSFLTCLRPDECKLIMVDPKVVELSRFRDIPHLMSPVITDMQKAVGVLEWACQEMDERYEKLSMVGVNNLAKFNALPVEEIESKVASVYGEDELPFFPRRLPCIVIIIDELADLMMMAKKEVEHHIARLAAKSRAVGIHLILATQRPSTDVITGLIKANMPARIAFQVASKIDSRIILDQSGAETLLGQGDMLYLPPGVGKVQRAQGVYVSDDELFKVVEHCKQQRKPEYHKELNGPVIGSTESDGDVSEYDEFFLESARLIIESGRGSVSLLQRKLGIGYGRASRIIDQLAEAGVLGAFREGKAREIMLTMEEYEARFFGGVFSGGSGSSGKSRKAPVPALAGVRDDERGPTDTPWDDD